MRAQTRYSVSPILPASPSPLYECQNTHVNGVLIRLDDDAEHLRSLQALLVNQLLTNVEQLRKRVLHNLVELLPLLASLESVHTADG